MDMTWDHLHATLTTLMELELYALYLCSSPQRSACLLVDPKDDAETKELQCTVLHDMRDEWKMIQEMEANPEMNMLLRKECPFVSFHHFREIPTVFDQNDWAMCPDTRACVQAWFPRYSFSSNIEDIFSSLQDACRRGVKNGDACLSNLQCVTVRAVQQKMDVEGGPNLVKLESEDYEGNAIRNLKPRIWRPDSASSCTPDSILGVSSEMRVDDVLKPYESTSAFNHCKSQLNFLRGLRLAKKWLWQQQSQLDLKSGRDLLEASEKFWIPSILQRGQLLQIDGAFYLCVGGTPAVPLEEHRLLFIGGWPVATEDETKMLSREARYSQKDPLRDKERVKALLLKIQAGQHPLRVMLMDDIAKVTVFSYSVHWLPANYAAKLGASLCLRRAANGLPPVVDMVKSKAIVRLTSDQLSKLLAAHGVHARKNSTKTFKTRQIMQLPVVTESCSQEELEALDVLLQQLDQKRRKQPKDDQDNAAADDEEANPVYQQ
ncbi:hemA [Symbiodinium sp. CCMP2592]|nr:hemA [Symbiodinium sp. CCMP2592]